MIGVHKDYLRSELDDALDIDPLHRAHGANRHKDWGLKAAVRRSETAQPSLATCGS